MNYLSHAYRFLDRPHFAAGTVVPDWLSVVDRKVRARGRLVQPVVDSTADETTREIGSGILRHHGDDDAFHRSETFMELNTLLSAEYRHYMPDRFDHRPAFLGHIVVELMLDAELEARHPGLLDSFYATMAAVDENLVQQSVNKMVTRPTDRLAWFIQRFREEKFLYDYATDTGMFRRLNQVLRRVKLDHMPENSIGVLGVAREILAARCSELLAVVEQ